MPKIKSEKQQLARESVNKLKAVIEERGWNLVPSHQEDDFGIDGVVEFFIRKKEGYVYTPNFSFRFQLKSTVSSKNKHSFCVLDLDEWRHSPIPFFLLFWNKNEDKLYWVNLHEFCNNLELTSPEKFDQKYLTIKFEDELDESGFDHIETVTRNLCKMAARAVNDNASKRTTIGNLKKKGRPLVALGYSFESADLSKTDMKKATMMSIDFKNADLSNADMRSGAFMGANFNGANLERADLRGGSFMGAFFGKAKLKAAKLQGAVFMGAFVANADFSGAEWDKASLWSISKSYDYKKAKFDKGILKEIASLNKIDNLIVDNLSIGNNKQGSFIMGKWTTVKTENEQGADYRSVPLKGKSLEKITFSIKPTSLFWRAGLKIVDPNGSILPLRSTNSILFHLGSTETTNHFGITCYMNGELVGSVNKSLKYNPKKPITIRFEVNQKNFIKFFVNDTIEFEPDGKINPRLLRKAYLVAWGDTHEYRVEFDRIIFFPKAV